MFLLGEIEEAFQCLCDKGGAGVSLLVQKCVYPGVLHGGTTKSNGFKVHGAGILPLLYARSQNSYQSCI